MLNETAQTILWGVFQLGLFTSDSKRAVGWSTPLYGPALDLPVKADSLLADYLSSGDREIFLVLAITALTNF